MSIIVHECQLDRLAGIPIHPNTRARDANRGLSEDRDVLSEANPKDAWGRSGCMEIKLRGQWKDLNGTSRHLGFILIA